MIGSLLSRLKSAVPAAAALVPSQAGPPVFQASDPSGPGASLAWIIKLYCLIIAGLLVAAGFFGLPAAVALCDSSHLLALSTLLGVIIGPCLAARAVNKRSAMNATVELAKAQAALAAPAPAVTSTTVNVGAPDTEGGKR